MVYNDHSKQHTREFIKSLILGGNVVSLVSDSGTPLISDPGFKLVQFLKQNDIYIDVIPGVCAPITALTISGLAPDNFFFGGFIPRTTHSKKKLFSQIRELPATLILFETSNRILSSLQCANEILGDRLVCIARELTKIHQEIKFDKISNIIQALSESSRFKGEIVLLIEGYSNNETDDSKIIDEIKELIIKEETTKNIVESLYFKYKELHSKNKIYSLVKKQI